ncbi:MAG: hypothetical protein HYV09_35105 [Deltaproteobacteria bacterium]|nr:hypothetical protein [Deltaproteobacteria bacterium]
MLRSAHVASLALVLLAACSSSDPPTPSDGGTSGAVTPTNAAWCAEPAPAGCGAVAVCGVCVPKPQNDLKRTSDAKEYTGTGAVDVSCFSSTPTPAGTSKNVKMKGWVKIFANGPDSKNVKVEIFEEERDATGKPTGKLGKLVGAGNSVDTAPACADPPVHPCTLKETRTKGGTTSERLLYPFEIAAVPTEVPLIARTTGTTDEAGWFPLYDYNVVARNDKLNPAGEFEFNVRALGNDDYASILKAAYNQPPQGGESAIAGEVHDCGDVRLSAATVGVAPTAGSTKPRYPLFYLSEVEDGPLPDSARTSTGKLGLYAIGGAKPGVYSVSSAGKIGADFVTLGSYKVQTFADSVTVYTFRGIRPWQVATK